jgi:hypothetical protein
MKLIIISNTEFGNKNHKSFIDYFNNEFIPYIKNNTSKDDILIHMGGLFNTKTFNITTIGSQVYSIFNNISEYIKIKFIISEKDRTKNNYFNTMFMFENNNNIEIIKEHVKYDFFELIPYVNNFEKIKTSKKLVFYNNSVIYENKKNKFNSPYQLSEKDEGKKRGFYIYDNIKKKFFFKENNFSKKFKSIQINNDEELNNINDDIFKDNIHLKINQDFFHKNENKINIILSKFNVDSISYVDNKDKKEENEIEPNLENNIIKEINKLENPDPILKVFNEIFNIYKEKIKN